MNDGENDEFEQQMLKDIHVCSEPAKTVIINCLVEYRYLKPKLQEQARAQAIDDVEKAIMENPRYHGFFAIEEINIAIKRAMEKVKK